MGKPAVGLGAAPALFGTVCLAVVSTIIYVHHNQKSEKEAMREGVRRDIEREKIRLTEQREARRSKPP